MKSNLQGHAVSVKEQRVHFAGIENSCTKWYDPELKALTGSLLRRYR